MHSGHLSQHKSGTEGAGIIYDDMLKWCWTVIFVFAEEFFTMIHNKLREKNNNVLTQYWHTTTYLDVKCIDLSQGAEAEPHWDKSIAKSDCCLAHMKYNQPTV